MRIAFFLIIKIIGFFTFLGVELYIRFFNNIFSSFLLLTVHHYCKKVS